MKLKFWLLLMLLWVPLFAFPEGNLRLLVRGQEILLDNFKLKDNALFLEADGKSLERIGILLGSTVIYDSSKRQLLVTTASGETTLPTEDTFVSLNAVVKACGASLTLSPEKNVWFLDPFLTTVSWSTEPKRIDLSFQATGPIEPTVMRLQNPDRLVIDFPFTVIHPDIVVPELKANDLVKEVHLAQFQSKPSIVRLVLMLSSPDVEWKTQDSSFSVSSASSPSGENQFALSIGPAAPAYYVLPKPEEEPSAPQGPSALTNIQVKSQTTSQATSLSENNTETLVMNFKLDSVTSFEWHRLKEPDNRVYIDLMNCEAAVHESPAYRSNLVNDIRVGQFKKEPVPVVRVTFELKNDFVTRIEPIYGGFRVIVTAQPWVASAGTESYSGQGQTGKSEENLTSKNHLQVKPNGIVIAIDPGHGGSDPGAHGGGMWEKECSLDIALRLRDLLRAKGFTVVMTRTKDVDVTGYHASAKAELQARADVANNARASVFLCLHLNSSEASWPHGIQTHWYKAIDLSLATILQKHLASQSGLADRGTLRNRFYVLRAAVMPSVLVEMGFLSNPGDVAKLVEPQFRQQLAEALSDGVSEYTNVREDAHL